MNTFQLSCFVAVAELLSFAKAAQRMSISQPAITHQIKTLEEELNVKLFRRSTRLVELTLEGQVFLSDARSMLSIAEQAKKRFSDPEERPLTILTLGSGSFLHLSCLSESLEKLSKEVENLHPRLQVARHEELFRLLENDVLDAVFELSEDIPPKSNVVFREISTSTLVCLCQEESPLADCDSISQGQLREEQIILCDPANLPPAMVDLQLKLAEGRTPSTVQFSPSPDASLTLVRAGLGVAVLPDILVEEQDALTAVPLLDAPALSFGLYYKSHPGDGILKRFAQIARENMTEK